MIFSTFVGRKREEKSRQTSRGSDAIDNGKRCRTKIVIIMVQRQRARDGGPLTCTWSLGRLGSSAWTIGRWTRRRRRRLRRRWTQNCREGENVRKRTAARGGKLLFERQTVVTSDVRVRRVSLASNVRQRVVRSSVRWWCPCVRRGQRRASDGCQRATVVRHGKFARFGAWSTRTRPPTWPEVRPLPAAERALSLIISHMFRWRISRRRRPPSPPKLPSRHYHHHRRQHWHLGTPPSPSTVACCYENNRDRTRPTFFFFKPIWKKSIGWLEK